MAEEFYIEFFTEEKPGEVEGIRIKIDLVTITDRSKPLAINLCDHPLYPSLKRYVKNNP